MAPIARLISHLQDPERVRELRAIEGALVAIHQDGAVVACAVDYEGRFSVGNIRDLTIRDAWRRLGEAVRQPHREHRWADLPIVCRGCGDWQVAGAEYEEERVEGTRPYRGTGGGREPRSERS